MNQKYRRGDLVRVHPVMPGCMSHFPANCDAIVIGSYKDMYGGSDTNNYILHLKGLGETSWYPDSTFDLVSKGQFHLLKEWERKKEEDEAKHANLDWIFANGKQVLEKGHGSSIAALAKCFGLDNLWGSRGEGFIWYENANFTLRLARNYLLTDDKEGYLAVCREIKEKS